MARFGLLRKNDMPKNKILKSWKKIAKIWKNIKPTYKPSKTEVLLFEKFLKIIQKNDDFKVLILGATPEIRDMLAKNKLSVTILDANPTMVKAMNQLVKTRNKNEKIVIGNWLKMPFRDNMFNLIISDHPTSSLNLSQVKTLFSEIHRVLKPNEHFIVDVHINALLKPIGQNKFIDKYLKNKKWFADFDNNVWLRYKVIMGDNKYYDFKTYCSSWGKFDLFLKKQFKLGKLTENECKYLTSGLGKDIKFYFYPKKVIKKIIQKNFKILNYHSLKIHPVYKYYWPCFAKCLKK